MSKDKRIFDLEACPHVYGETLNRFCRFYNKRKNRETKGGQENLIIRNSLFDIRYSLHG